MAKINPKIFRAYDIRGVYPEEVNAELAYLIGRALVEFLRKTNPDKRLSVVVSRDGRTSSVELAKAAIRGILEAGADAIDIGLNPTPVFYFSVHYFNYNGGMQITASHNPPEFNGFKIVKEKAVIVGENSGLPEIKKLAIGQAQGKQKETGKTGQIIKKKVLDDYLNFNFSKIDFSKIKPLNIAIDTANGVSGVFIDKIAEKLPGKIFHLFPEIDGSFPNHLPDPSEKENLQVLVEAVRDKKLDLGAAFDGDGDRIFFIDENGNFVSSSEVLALMSQIVLRGSPKAKVVQDVCISNIVGDIVRENGGQLLMSRVGYTFIKQKMLEENAVFGGELSGHLYHREHNVCEVPLFVLFSILKEISTTGKSFSQLIAPLKRYYQPDKLNLKVKDKQAALKALEQKYKQGRISHLDGVRIDFDDWWFCARPSNTEDVLRVVVEGKTKDLAEQKVKELTEIIKNA